MSNILNVERDSLNELIKIFGLRLKYITFNDFVHFLVVVPFVLLKFIPSMQRQRQLCHLRI